eukprot:12405032-Alexandrium_andersonii.AAC.1
MPSSGLGGWTRPPSAVAEWIVGVFGLEAPSQLRERGITIDQLMDKLAGRPDSTTLGAPLP